MMRRKLATAKHANATSRPVAARQPKGRMAGPISAIESLGSATRKLERAVAYAEQLYDHAPVAYTTVDSHGVIRRANVAAATIFGLSRDKLVGFPFRAFVTPADRRVFLDHLARYRQQQTSTATLRIESRSGALVPVELQATPALDDPGLCLTAVVDLTIQKRAEAELERLADAERRARDASSAKDAFIATLSHELRSPLTPVLAAVSSLTSERLSRDETARLCEIVARNVLAEARLIDDLLDVSRIATGKLRCDRLPSDLHEIAKEALAMFDKEIMAQELAVTVALEAAEHVVDCDPVRLLQVFANLVKNAIKFTPKAGSIALRSWNRDDRVVVEVADSGVGIQPESFSTIFNLFEQEQRPTREGGGGLGLGLAICKGIVDLHGGRISVHSSGRDRGARFLVELATTNAAPRARAQSTYPPPMPMSKTRRRVLIVEDHADITEVFALVLEQGGYEVITAPSAEAALAVDIERIDLVVSDLGLPDLSGYELLQQLKQKRDVRAIALSGYGSDADVRASHEAGFLKHLTKPVAADVLLRVVGGVLGQDPTAGATNPMLSAAEPVQERDSARDTPS